MVFFRTLYTAHTVGFALAIHDDVALLQTRDPVTSRKMTPESPVVTSADLFQKMNMSDPQQMSLLVADYAASAIKNGVTLDDATKAALTAMKTQLTDQSQQYVKDSHAADQNLLNTQHGAVAACDSQYTTATTEDAQSLAAVSGKAESHKTCRNNLKELDGVKDDKCQASSNFINNLAACPVPPKDPEGVNAFFSSVTAIAATKSMWEALDSACKTAEAAGTTEDETCDAFQEQYEGGFCLVRLQMHETCATYKSCHANTATELGDSLEVYKNSEGSRKSEWTSIEQIKCYIDVLVSDASNDERMEAMGQCKDADCDTSHLDINYPEPPTEKECDLSVVSTPPCSPQFMTEYEGMIDLTTCTPCADLPAHVLNTGGGGGGGGGDPKESFLQGAGGYCATAATGCPGHARKMVLVQCQDATGCLDDWISKHSSQAEAMVAFRDKCLEVCNAVDDCIAVDDVGSDYIGIAHPSAMVCYIQGNDIFTYEDEITELFGLVMVNPRIKSQGGAYLASAECPVIASCLEGTDKPGGGKWDTNGSCCCFGTRNCWCKKGAANCFNNGEGAA